MPNVHNVSLFREKNEYRLCVATSGGEEISSTEIQAASSITGNIAVMTNVMLAKGGEKGYGDWGKGKYADVAAGYYKPLGRSGVFEVYGGFGASSQQHQYSNNQYAGRSDLSFTKLFIQPSIGATSNVVDIAFSTRFCNLSFHRVNNQIIEHHDEYEYYYLDKIARNKHSFLIEPALTLRGGWKYVKVQLQMGWNINLTHSDMRFETVHGSLGLYITIADRYQKKPVDN